MNLRNWLPLIGALAVAMPARTETFPQAGLTQTITATRQDCEGRSDSFWIEIDGKGDCIRYYAAGMSRKPNAKAVIYIHGDRLWGEKPISYDDNQADAQQSAVDQMARDLSMGVVMIARPGTYGSSGSHAHRREMRELLLVKAAVDRVIERFGIKTVGLTGQSGGGTVASYVMARSPSIPCVALTSAALSMRYIVERDPQSIYDRSDAELYDPLAHLDDVLPGSRRQVFVIGMEGDRFSPLGNQHAYARALSARGEKVFVADGQATGPNKHSLDRTGRQAVAWCLSGEAPEAIQRRIAAKEVIG